MNVRIVISTLSVLVLTCGPASAQEGKESIAFRLKEWKSRHFDSVEEAEQQVQTLKKLGCETMVEQHSGHTDVTFRAVRWTDISTDTHEAADRWEQWMISNGFQTLHGHAHEPSRDAVAVRFHSTEWQSQHFDHESQAAEFAAMCRGLGCDVTTGAHSGHSDVRYRCAAARSLVCADHEQAHSIQSWLEKKGFQTEHAH